jgi:putative spermidine/putrescine transport system ATP-binding protein
MSNSNPLVKFENVQKSYDGEVLVVKDFNLDVAKGEFVTMLGPSGSGKTTCLMMLAGFEPTTNGTIYLKISQSTMCRLTRGVLVWYSRIMLFSSHDCC